MVEVRRSKCAAGTARWGAAVVAMSVAAVVSGACSGGGDGDGRDVGTAAATGGVRVTVTATASPSSTLTATQTPAATGTASGVPEVAQPTATVTTLAGPTPTPPAPTSVPAAPTSTPLPVEDGTFAVVVSQGTVSATVRVEVAATLDERQRGLMFRQELAEDAGMLFLFAREVRTGFWMRNTYVPLDIAYIGADGRVIEIKQGKPLDETPLTPGEKYRYVLEVNAGWFERHGMGPGAAVALPSGLPPATDN